MHVRNFQLADHPRISRARWNLPDSSGERRRVPVSFLFPNNVGIIIIVHVLWQLLNTFPFVGREKRKK